MKFTAYIAGNQKLVALIAAIAAFGTYSCMYAFRKPFTVATFDEVSWLGVDYKVWLIIAQTIGYTLSKFYGVKFVSESKPTKRILFILIFIFVSWLALLAFPLVSQPYNIIFLFVNGFPLGMVWGLVFSYLEGRKLTEFMGAFLSVSFIFSSGLVKSVGALLMLNFGVSEWWMPCITGLVFMLPLLFFTWLLNQTPPPSPEDIKMRNRRVPMTGNDRVGLLKSYGFGISFLIIGYVLLTLLRDVRDNFASNIWQELGYGENASIFTATEIPIAFVILILISALVLVKNNLKALLINHLIIFIGFGVILTSTLLFTNQFLSPITWMISVGLGLYMAYVPFNCVIFDRLMAVLKHTGNAGFLIYLADSFGYLGSMGFLMYKELAGFSASSWTAFFSNALLISSILGMVFTCTACMYFFKKLSINKIVPNHQMVSTPQI